MRISFAHLNAARGISLKKNFKRTKLFQFPFRQRRVFFIYNLNFCRKVDQENVLVVEFSKLFNRCISGLSFRTIYDDQTILYFISNLPPKVRRITRTALTAFRAASRRIVRRRVGLRRRHLKILTAYRLLCKKCTKKGDSLFIDSPRSALIHHSFIQKFSSF